MKNLLILLALLVGLNLSAQQANLTFDNDTVRGVQTKTVTTGSIVKYNGIVRFNFTMSGDTCNGGIKFYGSNDGGTTYNLISTTTHNSDAVVDYIVTQSPPQFLKYRLSRTGAAADTSRMTKIRFTYIR